MPRRRLHVALATFCAAAGLSSCIAPMVVASQAMVDANPIHRIAVFGSGQVVWPARDADDEPFFGRVESRAGLERVMRLIGDELEAKGYELVACEPAGTGYYAPWLPSRLVLDVGDDDGEPYDDARRHTLRAGRAPFYVYPAVAEDPRLDGPLRRIFEHLELGAERDRTLAPDPADVRSIGEALDVDTVGLVRVRGDAFTTARKYGTAILPALLRIGHQATDSTDVAIALLDARTGELHWSHHVAYPKLARDTRGYQIAALLDLLPERGANLPARRRLAPRQ